MRSSIIIASFVALAAALPALVPVDETSLAVRTESLDATTALEPRQGWSGYDLNWPWPETEFTHGGLHAQFRATNQGNGNYKFQFWNSSPPNGPPLNFRISNNGNVLASVNVNRGATTTVNVRQTGDYYNAFIQLA